MAFIRRDIVGGAVSTTIVGSITSLSTSWDIADATGWPLGTNGPFFAVLNRRYGSSNPDGTAPEEKVLVQSLSGTTLTLADSSGRGVDGTTAQAWSAPTTIEHCVTAVDEDEANQTASQTLGQVQGRGDFLTGGSANRLERTAPTADDDFILFDSSQPGGIRGGGIPDNAISASTMFVTGVVDTAAIEDHAVTTAKLEHRYWFKATSTSANNDATGVYNTFNWAAVEDEDNLLGGTTGTNITIPTGGAGLWVFEAGVRWGVSNDGSRHVRLVGSTFGNREIGAIPGVNNCSIVGSVTQRVVDSETIHVDRMQSDPGGGVLLAPAEGMHFFTARQLHV